MEMINVLGLEISIFAVIFAVMFLSMLASTCYALKKRTVNIKALYTLTLCLLPAFLRAAYCFVIGDGITMQPWVWIIGIVGIIPINVLCLAAIITVDKKWGRDLKTALVVFIISMIIALSGFTYMLVDLISGFVVGRIILIVYVLALVALVVKSIKMISKHW